MAPQPVINVDDLTAWIEANSFVCEDEPTPPPLPTGTFPPTETILLNSPGDIQMFMMTNDFEDVTDRFEILTGIYKNGVFSFHIRSLQDKLSARQGRLLLVPNLLQDLVEYGGYHITLKDSVTMYAPRADWPDRAGRSEWVVGPDGRYSVAFQDIVGENCELVDVVGYAASSSDIPWNWHYGLGVLGNITMVP